MKTIVADYKASGRGGCGPFKAWNINDETTLFADSEGWRISIFVHVGWYVLPMGNRISRHQARSLLFSLYCEREKNESC